MVAEGVRALPALPGNAPCDDSQASLTRLD